MDCYSWLDERITQFPLVSLEEAVCLLGYRDDEDALHLVNEAKKNHQLFAFNFFNDGKPVGIPLFQIDFDKAQVFAVVPKLCAMLSQLNDIGVYCWLTSFDEDLGCTPAEAFQNPEKEDTLMYLAGLFVSDSTLRNLDFTAESN